MKTNGAGGEEDPYFKWGVKKGVGRTNKGVQFYESFTLEDIEYRLYDCAYFFVDGQCETSIGKLVKMYETQKGEKKVRVVWFFRPRDIRRSLKEYEAAWDELFLACGDEIGVTNVNNVEAIIGKCNVVCMSKDPRNPPAGSRELSRSDYVFSRTFDTKHRIISKHFADAIAGVGVENFFNRIRDKQPLQRPNSSAAPISRAIPEKSFSSELRSTKLEKKDYRDGRLTSRTSPVSFLKDRDDHHVHVKKNPSIKTDIKPTAPRTKTKASGEYLASGSSNDSHPSKRRKLILNTPPPEPEDKGFVRNPFFVETAPSQNSNKGRWYKKLPFKEELKEAIEKSRLIIIENLEPSYTSLEVQDLCKQAFNETVDAKMIPPSALSSPNYGKALVIFQSTKAADDALSRLTKGYLMLPDQRIVVGHRNIPAEVEKGGSFIGHFSLVDKAMMTYHKRIAVSTSHCAQPNHIVSPMAMQWFALRTKSESLWKKLFERQAKEIRMNKRKETLKQEDGFF